jgi:hypothetical protein
MKKSLIFAIFGFSFSSSAFAEKSWNLNLSDKDKREFCQTVPKSPEEKCKERGGKWDDGLCVKSQVKKVVVRKKRRPPPAPPVIVNAPPPCPSCPACEKCKECKKCAPCKPCEAKSSPVTVSQKVTLAPPRFIESPPLPKPVKRAAPLPPKKEKWWWIGPGVFAAGIWTGEKDFFFGPYGSLAFAINQRFRVEGHIGMSHSPVMKDLGLWLGVYGAVRAYKGLFVDFGIETFWSRFQSLTVKRRIVAASVGPEYWFNNHVSISLRFLLGVEDTIESCKELSGRFTAGNLLTIAAYF